VHDVGARAPRREVVAQQDVRRVSVAQPHDRLREPGGVVRQARHIGLPRRADLCRNRGGVVVGRVLLEVRPQVRLRLQDRHASGRAGPLEEHFQVVVVRRHRRRIGQIGVHACGLTHRHTRVRLEQLVVGEDRHNLRRAGLRDVIRHEVTIGVPRHPSLARVHPAGQVLVPEPERGAHLRRAPGRVRDAQFEPVRPTGR
jgi:hypothetical protein